MSNLFSSPRNKYLAEIVNIRSRGEARHAVATLMREFAGAKTRAKKLRVVRATRLTANRVQAMLNKKTTTDERARELRAVLKWYEFGADKMFKEYQKSGKSK